MQLTSFNWLSHHELSVTNSENQMLSSNVLVTNLFHKLFLIFDQLQFLNILLKAVYRYKVHENSSFL